MADSEYSYPAGLLSFTLTGCAVGSTETITQYYFGTFDLDNLVLRKYNSSNSTYTTIEGAIFTEVNIGGEKAVKVQYDVTDGGLLDQDGLANGTIIDPVGPGEKVLAVTGQPAYVAPLAGFVLVALALRLALITRPKKTKEPV